MYAIGDKVLKKKIDESIHDGDVVESWTHDNIEWIRVLWDTGYRAICQSKNVLPDTPENRQKLEDRWDKKWLKEKHSRVRIPITFELQDITLTTTQGAYEVSAMVGVGTGLAYHRDPRTLSSEGFTITAVNCGYAVGQTGDYTSIFNPEQALEERITQHMIVNIATLLDWTQPREALITQIQIVFRTGNSIRDAFREAFNKACEQVAAEKKQTTAQEVQA